MKIRFRSEAMSILRASLHLADIAGISEGRSSPGASGDARERLIFAVSNDVSEQLPNISGRFSGFLNDATVRLIDTGEVVKGGRCSLEGIEIPTVPADEAEVPLPAVVAVRIQVTTDSGTPIHTSIEIAQQRQSTGFPTDENGVAVWLAAPGRFAVAVSGDARNARSFEIGTSEKGCRDVVMVSPHR